MTAIIVICACILIAFAVYNTIKRLRGKSKSSCCGTPETIVARAVADTDESHYPYSYRIGIEGMHCSNCARAVENALNSRDGIWARVDLGRSRALVLAKQEATESDFEKALRNTSYSITSFSIKGGENV